MFIAPGIAVSHTPRIRLLPHVFIWTSYCVRAYARLRPNRDPRRIGDVMEHGGPSKLNNRFFAPHYHGSADRPHKSSGNPFRTHITRNAAN